MGGVGAHSLAAVHACMLAHGCAHSASLRCGLGRWITPNDAQFSRYDLPVPRPSEFMISLPLRFVKACASLVKSRPYARNLDPIVAICRRTSTAAACVTNSTNPKLQPQPLRVQMRTDRVNPLNHHHAVRLHVRDGLRVGKSWPYYAWSCVRPCSHRCIGHHDLRRASARAPAAWKPGGVYPFAKPVTLSRITWTASTS
jgi:hypothetical protein